MVVCSARRTGRLGAFGKYLLRYSMFLLEKMALKFAQNISCKSCWGSYFLKHFEFLAYERLGNTH